MRRWGIVISAFYAAVVVLLLLPLTLRLLGSTWDEAVDLSDLLKPNWFWLWLGSLIAGQALLLFVSVDTSWRRRRPRQHIAISAGICGMFGAFLAMAMLLSVLEAYSSSAPDKVLQGLISPATWLFSLWTVWGAIFYFYYRAAPGRLSNGISWLLMGSVLELLAAIPAHIIIRRRNECTALPVTAFGIATGIAIMLACFGPGVLALYKKRADRYRRDRELADV